MLKQHHQLLLAARKDGVQNIDEAATVLKAVCEEIFDVKWRLAEEFVCALVLERKETTLNNAIILQNFGKLS